MFDRLTISTLIRQKHVASMLQIQNKIKENQLALAAAGLSYHTILAIIPLLAVSLAIFHAFGGMSKLYTALEPLLLEHLAHGQSSEVNIQIREFLSKIQAGTLGAGGLVSLLLTSVGLLTAIESSINRSWGIEQLRPYFQRLAYYWLVISLGPIALSFALGTLASQAIPFGAIQAPSLFLNFSGSLYILHFMPQRKLKIRITLPLSLLAGGLLYIFRLLFSEYTRRFFSYSKIYGSLAAIPLLLIWIYICWWVILLINELSVQAHGSSKK